MSEPKKSLEEFLAAVPDAPSSGVPGPEAKAEDADPKAESAAEESQPANTDSSRGSKSAPATSSTDDGADSPSTAQTPSADADAIRKALASGDLDTLADLIGEDPAGFDERTTKWAAKQRKIAKVQAERDAVAEKAARVVQRWNPVAESVAAVQAGDYAKGADLIERLVGEDFDSFVMKAIRARKAEDPRVPKLQQRLAELEPVAEEYTRTKQTAAERAQLETLRDELDSSHTVRKLEGWEQRVLDVLKESMDPDLGEPKLSVKQAADRVLRREREEYQRKAALFGGEPAPTRAPKARAPERASGSSPAGKRKVSREEWLAQHGK